MISWRNIAWRSGRALYMSARRESRTGDMTRNGEAHLQASVLAATAREPLVQVFDVGANRGEWSRHLLSQATADRARAGRLRIDAFEPVPTTRDVLDRELTRERAAGIVQTHTLAVSSARGTARIVLTSETGGTNTLHPEMTPTDGRSVDVELATADAFCETHGIAHVHLFKSDTEGHDLQVVKGAAGLLAAGRVDVLQFEYNHRWVFGRAYLRDVFEFVAPWPYRVARICPRSLDVFERWHPEMERFFECNYALVHERALAWFKTEPATFERGNAIS